MFGRGRGPRLGSIYSFLGTWLFLSLFFPMYRLGSLLLTLGAGLAVAYLFGRAAGRRSRDREEMGRLYMSIKDPEIRVKINEIMRITDKIVQDAIADPSDIPKIRKFMNYYLPTTIKLLNAYDRMDSQGIEGENIDKSLKSITEMLDAAIAAYKKQLDSLFANQALDIETDIAVMNAMLNREGLSDKKDFNIRDDSQGTVATG